jgi:protein-disulfide isomerase
MNDTDTPTTPPSSRRERRAAQRAARKGSGSGNGSSAGSGRSIALISAVALAAGVVVVAALILFSGVLDEDETTAVAASGIEPPPQELRVGRSLGDPDAPVPILLFEDPQCSACGIWSKRIEPLLIAGPVTDGDAFLTYKDFVFYGPESLDAAVAMRAAEEMDGKFWDFHDILYHNQGPTNSGAYSRDRLGDMAELIGLDRETFLALLDDEDLIAAVQAETLEATEERELTSTPTLIIGDEVVVGVPAWEDLRDTVAEQAAAAEVAA